MNSTPIGDYSNDVAVVFMRLDIAVVTLSGPMNYKAIEHAARLGKTSNCFEIAQLTV